MNIIRYQYGKTQYGFLDLFTNETVAPHTWITTANTYSIDETPATVALEQTIYNFTLQSYHDHLHPYTPRTIGDPVPSTIRASSTLLMLINNPTDAAELFATAKHCQQYITYYRQLFGLPHLQPTDDVGLAIASHILAFTTGFVDFPESVIYASSRPTVNHLSFGQQSVCNLTGVNYVSVR